MDKEIIHILLVDDDEDDFVLTKTMLAKCDYYQVKLDWEPNYHLAKKIIEGKKHDLYLIDYRLGASSGIELLKEVIAMGNHAPAIILTGQGDHETDIDALKAGAADYLTKTEITGPVLERTIRYILEKAKNIETLKHQELKYRKLFEKSSEAIFITSSNHLLIDINHSFNYLFGYGPDELAGISLNDLFKLKKDYLKFIELIEKDAVYNFEAVFITKNKEEKIGLISATMLHDIDPHLGYQGIIKDITQIRQAEEEIIKTEKLALTGQMARIIAHEVRNPLTNICLSLEQLKAESQDNEDILFYAEMAEKNTQRIDALITKLLKSSKPFELELKQEKIGPLIDQAMDLAQDRIELNNVEVVKDIEDRDLTLSLDEEKFKTALLNILVNGVEAMEGKEQKRLCISTKAKEDNLFIVVEDNGKGIEQEALSKLFDPFYTDKKSGMGLGLASAFSIVKKHKGNIKVKSEVGKGTCFIISVPH